VLRYYWPSPPWGRGWTAAGVFFSRGGPGEGVETFGAPSDLRPPPRQVLNRLPFPFVYLRIDSPDFKENSLSFNAAAEILKFG
jgi:hypothetical protein